MSSVWITGWRRAVRTEFFRKQQLSTAARLAAAKPAAGGATPPQLAGAPVRIVGAPVGAPVGPPQQTGPGAAFARPTGPAPSRSVLVSGAQTNAVP